MNQKTKKITPSRSMMLILLLFIGNMASAQSTSRENAPFGIEMGMSIIDLRGVCRSAPVHVQSNQYRITPIRANDMFESYSVWVDPEYGVYYLLAMGKDISDNGYGEVLKSEYRNLVKILSRKYGAPYDEVDLLKENALWSEPRNFMYAVLSGDREINTYWRIPSIYDSSDPRFWSVKGIENILVSVNAQSSTVGYITLSYFFSNYRLVESKTDFKANDVF